MEYDQKNKSDVDFKLLWCARVPDITGGFACQIQGTQTRLTRSLSFGQLRPVPPAPIWLFVHGKNSDNMAQFQLSEIYKGEYHFTCGTMLDPQDKEGWLPNSDYFNLAELNPEQRSFLQQKLQTSPLVQTLLA